MSRLNHLKQVLLRKPHRNVFYHHCCQRLNSIEYCVEIYRVINQLGDLVYVAGSLRRTTTLNLWLGLEELLALSQVYKLITS